MANKPASGPVPLSEEDYYLEGGFTVFTAAYHLKRGYCCGSGCRHCPYQQQSCDGDHQLPAPGAETADPEDAG